MSGPVLVVFEVTARQWRGWLGPSDRARLEKLARIEFPEDGAQAVVVVGPIERNSINAEAIRYVMGRVGVYPRERFREGAGEGAAACG